MLLNLSSLLLFFATTLHVSLAVPVHTHALYPDRLKAHSSVINDAIAMSEMVPSYQSRQFHFGVADEAMNGAPTSEFSQDNFNWDEEEDRSSLWKRLREMLRRHHHRFMHHVSHNVVPHLRQRIRDHVARHGEHFMKHMQKHLKAHCEKISKMLGNGGGGRKAMKSKTATTSTSSSPPIAPAAPSMQSPAPSVPKKKPVANSSVRQKNRPEIDEYVRFSSTNIDEDLEDNDIQNES